MSKMITNVTIPADYEPDGLSISRTNLFFIKSKHAFRQFKNHDYFQSRRHQMSQGSGLRSTQFVNSPAPFGINNAYNYICTEVSRNLLGKSHYNQHRNKICSVRDQKLFKTKTNIYTSSQKRKTVYQLPNLSFQDKKNHKKQQQPSRSLFQSRPKTQQILTLHFINRISNTNFMTYELKLNIYPFIISTFLKCKLNYSEITEQQFAILKSYIIDIYPLKKQYVEYKDMVNMQSIRQILAKLQNNCDVIYKQQMIRYFFVANQLAYEYQFEKIKDQIKNILAYQHNKDASLQEFFIFCLDDTQEIKNLYELIKNKGKLVFGLDQKVVEDYRNYLKGKQSQNQIANRIKKWKSIAPEESNTSQSFKTVCNDRYQKLFRSVQKKRNKLIRPKYNQHQIVRSSQFIDRQKLCKETNIFE